MIKEKELSLDRLERIAVSHGIRAIQKMIEVCGRARHGDAEQLKTERGKGKEAEANFAKAMEELGKAEENVRIFEENISEAYENGFDKASRQFEDQDQVPEGLDLTITETEISDDEAGPPTPVVLPSTSVIRGQQEAGSSFAAIVAADLPGPTNLPAPPAPTDSVAHANPVAPANPAAPVIDVDQEMIASAA
ncbi:hypothetical protein RHGRI_023999 [Rhododendron griersonianum]|uniref:Uncharacterized protein n=1 Tax=Rhododendron griersonianum TaxID=479676 RepID=A0AAV6J9E8_9ERIC|nr:hypothetical protein RHGRI_023999 [Rhododendron griersonianum]